MMMMMAEVVRTMFPLWKASLPMNLRIMHCDGIFNVLPACPVLHIHSGDEL